MELMEEKIVHQNKMFCLVSYGFVVFSIDLISVVTNFFVAVAVAGFFHIYVFDLLFPIGVKILNTRLRPTD